MAMLRISLLGPVSVTLAGSSTPVKLTPTSTSLLSYLLLQPHQFCRREVLMNVLWHDQNETRARACLKTALWRLRQVLEPTGADRGRYLVSRDGSDIGLNSECDYWLDVLCFESLAQKALQTPLEEMGAPEAAALEEAASLYTGDLLDGKLEDWALHVYERLRRRRLQCLARLMAYHEQQHEIQVALGYGRQILELDPLREEVHRAVMRLHVLRGDRARAIRQYQRCCLVLAEELDVPPMEETEHLYQQILATTRPQPAPTRAPETVAGDLREAMARVEEAQRQLKMAKAVVRRVLDRGADRVDSVSGIG